MKNNFIKPNPYVFPFLEFKDLVNKNFTIPEKEVVIDFKDLEKLVNEYEQTLNLSSIVKDLKGTTPEEKVFELFIHPDIRYGNLQMYLDNKSIWLEKFDQSIKKGQFVFSILGFPFKVPVAIKVERFAPDLGEVLALKRLEFIAETVETITKTKTTVNVVTEGVFGQFVGIEKSQVEMYQTFLKILVKKLKFKHLELIPLQEMEKYVKDFKKDFKNKVLGVTKLYKDGDKSTIDKVKGAYDSILRIVNPKSQDFNILMDVYNFKIPAKKLSAKAAEIREEVIDFTIKSSLDYFAYLGLRDDVNFLDRRLGKLYIPLTVSPKPNRLGIIPVNKNVKNLAHHGVSLYDNKNKSANILYLIDLFQSKKKITKVYLKGDVEKKPFFYMV